MRLRQELWTSRYKKMRDPIPQNWLKLVKLMTGSIWIHLKSYKAIFYFLDSLNVLFEACRTCITRSSYFVGVLRPQSISRIFFLKKIRGVLSICFISFIKLKTHQPCQPLNCFDRSQGPKLNKSKSWDIEIFLYLKSKSKSWDIQTKRFWFTKTLIQCYSHTGDDYNGIYHIVYHRGGKLFI